MRTFTLSQAKELLPMLQREMERLLPAYTQLKSIWESTAQERSLDVDDPIVRQACLKDRKARDAIEQVETSLLIFQELGVECKAIEEGIFDFPCLLNDRLVYLSWKIDETEIDHWHELGVDFGCRQPLFELGSGEGLGEQRLM